MKLKYEFDDLKEYEKAMNHLEDYHDCIECHGKIVCIICDKLGNTHCAYCNDIVKYPQLKKESFEELLKT